MFVEYLKSVFYQSRLLCFLGVIVIVINSYILTVFYTEFVLKPPKNLTYTVFANADGTDGMKLSQEKLEQLEQLNKVYEGYLPNGFDISFQLSDIPELHSGIKTANVYAMYYSKHDHRLPTSQEVEQAAAEISAETTNKVVTMFGKDYKVINRTEGSYTVSIATIVKYELPIKNIQFILKGMPVKTQIKYTNELTQIFSEATVKCIDQFYKLDKTMEKTILYIIMAFLGILNLIYMNLSFMEQKKKIIAIYRLEGISTLRSFFFFFLELCGTYLVGAVISFGLFIASYKLLYRICIVSSPVKPDISDLFACYLDIGAIIIILFGILQIWYVSKSEVELLKGGK